MRWELHLILVLEEVEAIVVFEVLIFFLLLVTPTFIINSLNDALAMTLGMFFITLNYALYSILIMLRPIVYYYHPVSFD